MMNVVVDGGKCAQQRNGGFPLAEQIEVGERVEGGREGEGKKNSPSMGGNKKEGEVKNGFNIQASLQYGLKPGEEDEATGEERKKRAEEV